MIIYTSNELTNSQINEIYNKWCVIDVQKVYDDSGRKKYLSKG